MDIRSALLEKLGIADRINNDSNETIRFEQENDVAVVTLNRPEVMNALNTQIERVQAQALVADVKEQGRALLTNTALQNVGALSALEAHLIQVAPLGEARYKHIVDAYAMGAAQAIARW